MKKEYADAELQAGLNSCQERIQELIHKGIIMTAALYHYKRMLFFYYEAMEEQMVPEELLSALTPYLETWPSEDKARYWAEMYPVFYHAVPQNREDWMRGTPPQIRRGRIAKLKTDKLFSYICHHRAIVEEGLLKGDKYQFIALHENILFSYFEEPKIMMNVKRVEEEESQRVKEWIAAEPESHFERYPGSDGNFLFIPAYFALGMEGAGE